MKWQAGLLDKKIDEEFNTVDKKIDEKFNTVDKNFDKVDQKFVAFDQQLRDVAKQQAELTGKLEVLLRKLWHPYC